MDLTAAGRLLLVFGHLILCVFALHCVISTDWRMLRSSISARQLDRAHRRVLWLLGGLWLSGLAIIGLDTGFDMALIAQRPKLVAKLVCVTMLTLNGVLLRGWCFPRLAGEQPLGRVEAMALMACGAVSTTSWLMAAFFGIARPMQTWSVAACLALYWAALALALPVALSLEGRLRRGREARAHRMAIRLAALAPLRAARHLPLHMSKPAVAATEVAAQTATAEARLH